MKPSTHRRLTILWKAENLVNLLTGMMTISPVAVRNQRRLTISRSQRMTQLAVQPASTKLG